MKKTKKSDLLPSDLLFGRKIEVGLKKDWGKHF